VNVRADQVVAEFLANRHWNMSGQCVPVKGSAKVVAQQREKLRKVEKE
jgi:hypothetical protein